MWRRSLLLISFLFTLSRVNCQIVTECPQNIGFESGTFANWQCYSGFISGTGRDFPSAVRPAKINRSGTSPISGVHTLMNSTGTDPYGGFSLASPNGSNYIIRLGNDVNGRSAEGISYTVNVPSNVDSYSIIFNYAVVLENPDHELDEQPKFTAKVIDVSTNTFTECGSFEFTAPGPGSGIPGFETSPLNDSILYKPWSPVMVNLSNYLGRTIRLEFTTNDCSRGRHFGYAYIDFNENCSIPITGNISCPEVDEITLRVIPGLAQYNWFDAQTLQSLGTSADLKLSPVPSAGTKIGVELIPYPGLGCTQTLYTTITSMYMNVNDPPEKCAFVDITATLVTVGNSSDLRYTYWKDQNASIPLSDPKHITKDGLYYIKGQSSSGCIMTLPVVVTLTKLAPIVTKAPLELSYPETADLNNTFEHQPGLNYTFWTDPDATNGVKNPARVRTGGTFYIKASNAEGCFALASVTVKIALPDVLIPNTFTPNGDGINDVFTILLSDKFMIKSFRIYNRWGQIVYETIDINRYWDGLTQNTRVPEGVYYWILEGDEKLKYFKKSGYVTVLR